ncbi:MAG: hypothetical protein IJC86_04925 [Clostridia bacterium]|nr:hypothetical protein [Clostridia bacterium]
MDAYCEQVVKRESGVKQKVISGILIGIFALIELFFIFIYILVPQPFWIMFTLIVAAVAVVVLCIALPRINNVDFDYTVMGNTFKVDKVINKNSRKKYLTIHISNIEDLGVIEGDNIPSDRYARTRDCTGGTLKGSYYCVYRESEKGKCLLLFSPNEKTLEAMRPSLNHELMLKLLYKNKR